MNADVIIAAFGFNESFAGIEKISSFEDRLAKYLSGLTTKAYNGKVSPLVVLVSPIANENIKGVAAADRNNKNLDAYVKSMHKIAQLHKIGFVNVFKRNQVINGF